MSFNNGGDENGTLRRKFQQGTRMSAALRHIEDEGASLIRYVANREPAKVVALKIGKTPRQVYNLREGETETGWLTFVAMAMNYPEVRAALARWLNLSEKNSPAAAHALDVLRRLAANMAEEGDQS